MGQMSPRQARRGWLGCLVVAFALAGCGTDNQRHNMRPATRVCGVRFGPRVVNPRPVVNVSDQNGDVQLATVPPDGNVVIQLASCGKGGDLISVEGATVAGRYADKSGIVAVWLKSLPTATHVRVAWAGDGRRLTLDMPAAH